MNKRLFVIIIVVLLVVGAAIYYFFYSRGNGTDVNTPGDGQAQERPSDDTVTGDIPVGSFAAAVTEQQAFSPELSLGGGEIWYFNDQGKLLHNSSEGGAEQIFELPQDLQVSRVFWPVSGNDFIVEQMLDGKPIFKYYDSQEKNIIDLPTNIVSLAWLSDGQHIVYLWRRTDGVLELKKALADSSQFRTLKVLEGEYDRLYAASSGGFVILRQPIGSETNTAAIYTFSDASFRVLTDRGLNLDFSIAPNANKIVFSRVSSSREPELWIVDTTFNQYENLGIKTTASKIVWDGFLDRFYVAIDADDGSGGETLYHYNISKQELTEVWKPDASTPAVFEDMRLDSYDGVLFFVNGLDGKLYRFELPK